MDEWVAWGVDLADLAVKAVAKNVTSKGSKGYLPVGTLAWMAPEMVLPPYQVSMLYTTIYILLVT
jgi:hypothetical protein